MMFPCGFLFFFFAILISTALSFSRVDGGLKVKEVGLWREVSTPVTGLEKLGGES